MQTTFIISFIVLIISTVFGLITKNKVLGEVLTGIGIVSWTIFIWILATVIDC